MEEPKVKEVFTIGVPTPTGYVWTKECAQIIVDQAKAMIGKRGSIHGYFGYIGGECSEQRLSHAITQMWTERVGSKEVLKVSVSTLHNRFGELIDNHWQDVIFGINCTGSLVPGTTIVSTDNIQLRSVDVVNFNS